MRELKGVIPVLLTPFTNNGDVDVESLSKLVEHLNNKDIGGFWVLGTGSEDMNLTFEQRLVVAQIVCGTNAGRVPIILGTSFFSMRETLDFMEATSHLEFDAYHFMPYHPLLSLDRIEWMYKKIADHSKKPLWMYTSANWARFIPPSFIEKMKDYPNIAGVKFSTSNAAHTEKVISMADDKFQVITAVVRTFYANLCLGVKAATTVEACPFADEIIRIYADFQQGNMQESLEHQQKLNRMLEDMPTSLADDNFFRVAEGKYILSLRGLCLPLMSSYYRDVNPQEKDSIKNTLIKHNIAF